ncbi:hypothetical protein JGU71_12235 [Antrihabitans sp. YC3-6]|uniref:DedA family protein n=1 Tax=Antrihabitans stalagmiti TaxID=2799499 RepID=A0A934NQM8_9NOCA|nr:hypothetical protein [Antrihabitans stalagmiti]MBJ8339656.1 hypothetical protein [Antrihabitans stalagmiti]
MDIAAGLELVASAVSAPLLLAVIAAILVVESGSVVGVLLPGSSIVLSLGVLVGTGTVPMLPAVCVVAIATTVGTQYSFLRAREQVATFEVSRGLDELTGGRLSRAVAATQRMSDRSPRAVSFGAPLFGGIRTLAPRFLAQSPIRYQQFAGLSALSAWVWSVVLVSVGAVAGAGDRIGTVIGLVGIPAFATFVVIRRWRRRCDPRRFSAAISNR